MKILCALRKRDKVVITFDNGESLSVNFNIYADHRLRPNDEVNEEQVKELESDNLHYLIKQSALRYLGRRPHSEFELKLKLERKKFPRAIVDNVLKQLKEFHFIDDKHFADILISELKAKKYGLRKIEHELFKRGIKGEELDSIIKHLPADYQWQEQAGIIAQKKYNILKQRNYDDGKIKGMLYSFLASRGYEYEIIQETVESIITGNGD